MTESSHKHLATSTGTITKRKTAVWANAPVVMAMLTNNNLSSCQDVMNMLNECRRTNSEDQVCFAAMKQMEACGIDGRL
eukprot:CAMPEP_0197184002 /NCGR_PEP_ID=MMETSP1423-20130617/8974_1 /TAXON_ID=476441 /ORGANISM="Pseudo-nitzschia heimii, Strain UNC1101" /LENGTH=78 /DNA_ID=CAMNT_0042634709 /DNA_START=59 /DNA_END=295 /DNA_ORIENTATION=+